MSNEQAEETVKPAETQENSTPPEPKPEPKPKPKPEATPEPASPPPAATEVLKGKETEQTADLKRKLEAKERELKERETKLSAKELELQRKTEQQQAKPATPAQQKAEWLNGNALFS